jgi:hypothetical protein
MGEAFAGYTPVTSTDSDNKSLTLRAILDAGPKGVR